MADALQRLIQAQDDLILSEEERDKAKAAHRAAVGRWQDAIAHRRQVLLDFLGDDPTPEHFKQAAQGMALTLPRIYQLSREAR